MTLIEFNLLEIMARNGAGMSTVKGVMSYLHVGVQRTTDDIKKYGISHHYGNNRQVAVHTGSEHCDIILRNPVTSLGIPPIDYKRALQ